MKTLFKMIILVGLCGASLSQATDAGAARYISEPVGLEKDEIDPKIMDAVLDQQSMFARLMLSKMIADEVKERKRQLLKQALGGHEVVGYVEREVRKLNKKGNPLLTPTKMGQREQIDELLPKSTQAQKDEGLVEAVEAGHIDLVIKYLFHNANPCIKNSKGIDALEAAHNKPEIKTLIEAAVTEFTTKQENTLKELSAMEVVQQKSKAKPKTAAKSKRAAKRKNKDKVATETPAKVLPAKVLLKKAALELQAELQQDEIVQTRLHQEEVAEVAQKAEQAKKLKAEGEARAAQEAALLVKKQQEVAAAAAAQAAMDAQLVAAGVARFAQQTYAQRVEGKQSIIQAPVAVQHKKVSFDLDKNVFYQPVYETSTDGQMKRLQQFTGIGLEQSQGLVKSIDEVITFIRSTPKGALHKKMCGVVYDSTMALGASESIITIGDATVLMLREKKDFQWPKDAAAYTCFETEKVGDKFILPKKSFQRCDGRWVFYN